MEERSERLWRKPLKGVRWLSPENSPSQTRNRLGPRFNGKLEERVLTIKNTCLSSSPHAPKSLLPSRWRPPCALTASGSLCAAGRGASPNPPVSPPIGTPQCAVLPPVTTEKVFLHCSQQPPTPFPAARSAVIGKRAIISSLKQCVFPSRLIFSPRPLY